MNIPEIPFEELEEATDRWAKNNELGRGGFSVVYQGKWISKRVAIKKHEHTLWLIALNELRYLNNIRHDNIVPVYGYAIKDNVCLVVYQLMPGGSVDNRLSSRSGYKSLTWPERWNIAKGVARGLIYLHRYNKKPLIHGGIKTASILLDSFCEAKICDFGFSRKGLHDQYLEVAKVRGTRPYLPQEYIKHNILSTFVDVFGFGVVLFELATGLKAYDKRREHPFLYDHMAAADETIIDLTTPNDQACFNLCNLMVSLGKNCTNENVNNRLEMMSVLKILEDFVPLIKIVQD